MADKNKSANLCESVEEGSILNITQDNLISTKENIHESVQLEIPNVNETVEVECSSKSHNVDVFKQLTMIMEMMSGMKTDNEKLNASLNDKFDQQNTSLNDNLKTS